MIKLKRKCWFHKWETVDGIVLESSKIEPIFQRCYKCNLERSRMWCGAAFGFWSKWYYGPTSRKDALHAAHEYDRKLSAKHQSQLHIDELF